MTTSPGHPSALPTIRRAAFHVTVYGAVGTGLILAQGLVPTLAAASDYVTATAAGWANAPDPTPAVWARATDGTSAPRRSTGWVPGSGQWTAVVADGRCGLWAPTQDREASTC